MTLKTRLMADSLFLVSGLVLCLFAGFWGRLGAEPPRPGQPVLVIAPPWGGGAARVIADSGGVVLGLDTAPLAAVAVFSASGYASRARAAGAWLLRDAGVLAALCGPETP